MCNLRSTRKPNESSMAWEEQKSHIHDTWKSYWFETHPHEIAEYSWTYLFTGGKEIRARLFCELWKYLSPDLPVCGELAFVVECIHATSLVMDDSPYMDNADFRRGRPCLHRVFGQKKAGLICYDLMHMARTIWIKNRPVHVDKQVWYDLMKTKLQRLMMGQWYDMEKKGTLVELASLKTGVLFELVSETVAVCIDLDPGFWRIWGNHLGILFQWTDDWLDQQEDLQQENRNAFNEAYEITHRSYQRVWRKIEEGIGAGWFTRPFGKYMYNYFTKTIPFLSLQQASTSSLSGIHLPYPIDLPFPEVDRSRFRKKDILNIMNGKDILMLMFMVSNHMKEDDQIKTDLWKIDEKEWNTIPEMEEWFDEVERRTGWDVRPEYESIREQLDE